MKLRGKITKLFLVMLASFFVLAPVAVYAAEGSTVVVKGYPELDRNDLSVSNVVKKLDAKAIDEILDAYFETNSPAVVTTMYDTAVFEVYKMVQEGEKTFTSVGDPLPISGKAKVLVPGPADSDDGREIIVDVSELKNYNDDVPPLLAGCKVTLKDPGYYFVNFMYEGYADSCNVLIHVLGGTAQSGTSAPASAPAAAPEKAPAKPTASKVLVNGTATSFEAYNINGNNYFKLRDLAKVVSGTAKQFEVEWNAEIKAINLLSDKAYTAAGGEMAKGDGTAKNAVLNTSKIYKDGEEISLTAYNINGNNYFKLRDIAKSFDIGVTFDGATNTVGIDTAQGYTE